MRKGILIAAFAVLMGMGVVRPAFAESSATAESGAQIEVYSYDIDGSIDDVAVSEDGLVIFTGMAYREAESGRPEDRLQDGYALCIDARGNERWRLRENLGSLNTMRAPVFGEGGSASMLLYTRTNITGGQWEQVELLRVDSQGQIVSRQLIMGHVLDGRHIGEYAMMDNGYLISVSDGEFVLIPSGLGYAWEGEESYYFYGRGGNRVRELDELHGMELLAISRAHALMREEDGNVGLYSLDAHGNVKRLTTAFMREDNVYVEDLVSLENGGAAVSGCVWKTNSESEPCWIRRYDAQGNVVMEVSSGAWRQSGLVRLQSGFALVGFWNPRANGASKLMFLSDDGAWSDKVSLEELGMYVDEIAAMPDGSLLVLGGSLGDDGEEGRRLCAAIIPGEEF